MTAGKDPREQVSPETEEKFAENHQAVNGSESLLKAIFDNALDGILLAEIKTRQFVSCNNMICQMLGYSADELKELTLADIHPSEAVPYVIEQFEQQCRGEISMAEDIPVKRKDGSIFFADINASPIEVYGRNLMVGFFHDISKRKEAIETLKESEEKFRSLTEQSPNMIFINQGGKIVFANRQCEESMGYSIEEFTSPDFDFRCLIAPEHLDLVNANFARHMKGQEVPPYEGALITRDGKRLDSIHSTRIISYKNKPAILGIVTNIAEQKKTENALRESKERYQTLFEQSPDAILLIDPETSLPIEFNNNCVTLLGYSRKEFAGLRISDYEALETPEEIVTHRNAVLEKGHATFETKMRTKAGDIKDVLVSIQVVSLGNKQVFHNVFRDITEHKQAVQQLKQRERQQAAISKLGLAALTGLELDPLFRKTTELVAETLGVEYCKILELAPDRKSLLLRSGVGWKKGLIGRAIVSSGLESQAGYTLKLGHPVIVRDLQTETRFNATPLLRDHGVVSGMSVIIQGTAQPWGILGTHTKKHRVFNEDDISFIQSAANFLALAIDRKQSEIAFQAIIKNTAGAAGHNFFTNVTSGLCAWLGVECAIIGEIKNEDHVRALSMYLDGKAVEYEYALQGTPCKNVMTKGYCAYPEKVRELFPDDKDLVEMQAEGYVGVPLRDKNNRPVGVLCAISRHKLKLLPKTQEVFEIIAAKAAVEIVRKKSEQALQEEQRKSRQVIDTARDAFVSMDESGIITDWNPCAETLFGWHREEVLGRLMTETIIPEELREAHTKGLKHYLVTGEAAVFNQDVEITALHRDGHTISVELSIVPGQSNGTTIFNAFIRDISERSQAREALEKSREQLKASLIGTVVAVSKAVGARDPYTAGHQQRVSQLARSIAQEMGLDKDRIDGLRMGATIHDVGKIYLPAEILSKPTKLTDIEYELIKSHSQVGYDILKDIVFTWPIADIAYQHHERLDGSGYPQGLKGEGICLEARIVAVADVVEAMSSHRPYRPALGVDAALEEIESKRGKWFEPDAVDACLKLFREKSFSFKQ